MNPELKKLKDSNQFLIHKMEVNDKNFDKEVIKSEIPVLIEFWASWCVPCKAMEYLLYELKKDYDNKIKIVKLNIDRYRSTPKKYKLTGVPTFMTFNKGEIIETKIGAQSKENLVKMIQKVLT